MADSDNSRTLPSVTRGDLHSFVAASLPTNPGLAERLTTPSDIRNDDLAFTIWREWCAARQRLIESCLRQQGLERRMFATVGSPSQASETWDSTAEEVGYREAVREEERAFSIEDDIAATLWNTPAQTLAGATGKLHAVITKGQPSVASEEYPWPQIRSIISDLAKIDEAMSSPLAGEVM